MAVRALPIGGKAIQGQARSTLLARLGTERSGRIRKRLLLVTRLRRRWRSSSAPSDPLVAVLEVLGWSAEDQQGQPLTLGIGGHVVEPFTHRFEASQIVMLIEQFFETLQFGALQKPHLDLV